MSNKYELKKEDLKRIARQILVIYTPVLLLFLSQMEDWGFDVNVLYALAVSVSIDALRRYLTNYNK